MWPKNSNGVYPVDPRTRVQGSTVIIAPTLRHVKAVQTLLVDKIPQCEPKRYQDALVGRGHVEDVLWLEVKDFSVRESDFMGQRGKRANWLDLIDERDMFYASHFLLVDNEDRLVSIRDQTGCKYGDFEKRIPSETLFANYPMVLRDTPEV